MEFLQCVRGNRKGCCCHMGQNLSLKWGTNPSPKLALRREKLSLRKSWIPEPQSTQAVYSECHGDGVRNPEPSIPLWRCCGNNQHPGPGISASCQQLKDKSIPAWEWHCLAPSAAQNPTEPKCTHVPFYGRRKKPGFDIELWKNVF